MIWTIIIALTIVTGFLSFALHRVSTRIRYFIANIEETFFSVESYREHLEKVYALDAYHGDDTLQSLLEHSRELSNFLGESQQVFSLTEKEFLEYVESQSDTDNEDDASEAPPQEIEE
jgi:predicted nucleotidyltransferase